MTILKGSTYIAVVPLTAIVSQNLTYLFGFTKYLNLNLNLNLISLMLFPINLVFQMSDFRYEIKETSLPVIRTEILTEKSGFGPYQRTTNNWSWFLVDPVDDDDWRDRPRTDPSSVSDLGTGLGGILVLKRLDSAQLSCRDSLRSAPWFSVSARSIDRDSLVRTSSIEPRISICIYSTRT